MHAPIRPCLVLLLSLAAACGPKAPPAPTVVDVVEVEPLAHHPALYATAWAQASAEYAALTRSVYGTATAHLEAAVADTSWSALPGQEAADKPPAIILDLDETVLDNSPWQVRAIREDFSYPSGWQEWCNEGQAEAIPGVVDFLTTADAAGVDIFYVSNRKAPVEEATRRNLAALGLPIDEAMDVVLLRNEQEDWTSDKTTRRDHVASTHRVIMLFGDNLGDFVEVEGYEARHARVAEQAAWWGTRWFMLPNPVYGSWFDAIRGEVPEGTERDQSLLDALDDKN